MNKTRVGGLAAGMFAVGVLTGLAGTAVARDAAPTSDCPANMSEHMAGQDLTDMMGGSMMGGSMMGGSMMGQPGGSMDPDSMGPGGQHGQHHPKASAEVPE